MARVVFFALLTNLFAIVLSTKYNEKSNITRTNPDFPFEGEMFTGFLVVENATQANIYYHLFAFNESKISQSAPLIIWLQGGPGCGSSLGNYGEIGPVQVSSTSDPNKFTYQKNDQTWNQYAHLLFIDQPTGSGFSVANGLNVSSSEKASVNFQVFLARFYQIFPELKSSPLYLFGESYAGKYIPTFAYDLLQNQTFLSEVNLAGVGIGDGWSNPLYQIPTTGTFGYVTGLTDPNGRDFLRQKEVIAITDILNGNFYKATEDSNPILNNLTQMAGGISSYDYRQYGDPAYPYSLWLNTTDTQDFLNIPFSPYADCNSDVSDNFEADGSMSVANLYPEIIERIPVLLYNGQDDDNCDYEGVNNYINALNWTDIKDFRRSKRVSWKLSDGSTAGLVKAHKNLTFLFLFKAGHMVPAFQPIASREMVYNFINGIPFINS